MVTTDKCKRI